MTDRKERYYVDLRDDEPGGSDREDSKSTEGSSARDREGLAESVQA